MELRINPNKVAIPKASGLGPKLTGRVKPVENIKVSGVTCPVEWATSSEVTNERAANVEKTSAINYGPMGKSMLRSATTAIGAMGAAAVVNAGVNYIKTNAFDKPEFERSFKKCLELNTKLRSYPESELRDYFKLVAEASPTVAKNPLLAAQYLQYLLDYKGTMNFGAFGDLTKLESQILRNRADSNPLAGVSQKALIENSIKSIFPKQREQ